MYKWTGLTIRRPCSAITGNTTTCPMSFVSDSHSYVDNATTQYPCPLLSIANLICPSQHPDRPHVGFDTRQCLGAIPLFVPCQPCCICCSPLHTGLINSICGICIFKALLSQTCFSSMGFLFNVSNNKLPQSS